MQCLCCGSMQTSKNGRKSGYSIYSCNNCEFQFVHPLPADIDIQKHYHKLGVDVNTEKQVRSAIDKIEHSPNSPKRDWYNKVLDLAMHYCERKRLDILEIGSSLGYFIHYVNNLGHNAIGTEVTEKHAAIGKGIINGQIVYIENNQYDKFFHENMFDLIYMEHVLEHIMNPSLVFQQIRKCLTKTGIVFLSVPNHKSLLSRILKHKWPWFCPPDHLYYYNEKALRQFLTRNDMEILKIWTGDYYFRSIYQFYSLDLIWHKFVRLSNRCLKTKFNVDHLYQYPQNLSEVINLAPYFVLYPIIKLSQKYGMGSELVVIARKAG